MGRAGRSGGGGSFGGGRSSFGGGSRSSGGRSSFSSGSSFGSSSSSSRSSTPKSSTPKSSGGSIFGGSSTRPSSYGGNSYGSKNIIIANSGNRYNGGSNGYNTSGGGNYRNDNDSSGCLTTIMWFIIITVVVSLLLFLFIGMSGNVTYSTIEREALPKGSVIETKYFTDELDWIKNKTELEKGLKHFYNETGVQPYLYITDNVDGKHIDNTDGLKSFSEKLYGELFKDEAHLLFIFYEYDGDYAFYYVAGAQAKTVVDSEAADILMDYVEKYYYSSMSEEEMFSTAFANAADDMMEVYESPWIKVFMIIGAGAVLVIIFVFWKSAKEQKNKEAEQTEKILNTKLDEFGDSDIEDLENKYK